MSAHDERDRGVEGILERAIAVQVRRHRRARGMTVGELAVRAGISKAMLSKIENSLTSSSLTTLARLASALDVPVTALFRGADVDDREAVFTPADGGARMVARATGSATKLLGRAEEAGALVLGRVHARSSGSCAVRTSAWRPISSRSPSAARSSRCSSTPAPSCCSCWRARWSTGTVRPPTPSAPGTRCSSTVRGVHGPQELLALPIRFLSVVAYGDAGE